jgi:UDP-N-acetylmuramoylalanine--D-glutamate ligase
MDKALVYGAGVSGIGAYKLLLTKGYEVTLVDDVKGVKKEEIIDRLEGFSLMIKSPGIPFDNELVVAAKAAGIEIIDEIELAYRYYPHKKIIAITGTNGKTTTTTKTKELLEYAGFKAVFAGNIGNTFAEVALSGEEYDYIVLELSSYQLEAIKEFKPYIAMVINLTPDHMNRYETLEAYYDSKFNIFVNQDSSDFAVINLDDDYAREKYENKKIDAEKIFVSQRGFDADVTRKDGKIFYRNEEIMETEKMGLKGIHNIENVMHMVAVAKIAGIENSLIRDFFYKTEGLEHRVEEFYKAGNTVFINDSKGTNIDATIKALDSYDEKVILICGGKDKKLDNSTLVSKMAEKSKMIYLMGETADKLEEMLVEIGYEKEYILNLKTIEAIVEELKADIDINEKNIVLFSPAASSFDQFKSFEERGRIFKELVRKKF